MDRASRTTNADAPTGATDPLEDLRDLRDFLSPNGPSICEVRWGVGRPDVISVRLTRRKSQVRRDFLGSLILCDECRESIGRLLCDAGRISEAIDARHPMRIVDAVVRTLDACDCTTGSPGSLEAKVPAQARAVRPIQIGAARRTPKAHDGTARAPRVNVVLPRSVRVPREPEAAANVTASPELQLALDCGTQVTVIIGQRARSEMIEHSRRSGQRSVEVGGMLIGDKSVVTADGADRIDVHVTDALLIPARDASVAHVTFGPDDWSWVDRVLDEQYPGKARLGWYHTHPTQGIFFSKKDRDVHSVFTEPHQLALVIDPRTFEAGAFYWADAEARRIGGPLMTHLIEPRADEASGAPRSGTSGEPKIATLRVLIAIGLVARLMSVAYASGLSDPRSVILYALAALVLLRGYTSGFFRPEAPVEARILEWFQVEPVAALERAGKPSERTGGELLLPVLVLLLLIVTVLLFIAVSSNPRFLGWVR